MEATRHFDSPLFGPTRDATTAERAQLEVMSRQVPVAMFQVLCAALNRRGFLLSIRAEEEPATEKDLEP